MEYEYYFEYYKDLAIEFIQKEGIDKTEKAFGIPCDVLEKWVKKLKVKEGTLSLKTFSSPKRRTHQSEVYFGCRLIRYTDQIEEGSELSRDTYAIITDNSRKNSFFKAPVCYENVYKWLHFEEANRKFWWLHARDLYDDCIDIYTKKKDLKSFVEEPFIFEYFLCYLSYITRMLKEYEKHETNYPFLFRYYTYQYVMKKAPYHTDMWCKMLQENALRNFDINMEFFCSLNEEKFNYEINKFCREHPDFSEVTNLNDYAVPGLYVMILDKYKQLYIGTSSKSIKSRIMSHWSQKVPLDRLIFGSVEKSIISINSFRHHDNTRILAYPYPENSAQTSDENEYDLIEKSFSAEFLLNRCAGGKESLQESIQTIRQHEK